MHPFLRMQLALAVEALSVSAAAEAAAAPSMMPLLVSPSPSAGDYGHIARSYIGLAEVSRTHPAAQAPEPLRPERSPFLDMRMQMSPQKLVQASFTNLFMAVHERSMFCFPWPFRCCIWDRIDLPWAWQQYS